MSNLSKFNFTKEVDEVLKNSPKVIVPKTRDELIKMAFGGGDANVFSVCYDVNGKPYEEAIVTRCKNGAAVNYTEDYMRRRDPECLIIGDDKPTDKPRYKDVFNKDFGALKKETFEWLKTQELAVVPVMVGGCSFGYEAVLIAPTNAGFFACGLADLQYFQNIDEYEGTFTPKVVIYLAPPFRHTHFDGQQIVVHNRLDEVYELFAYNLYPGPSAKKGIYGFLLDVGEREGWTAVHTAAVKIVTPYENEIVVMHEGASGGGKSEMCEHIHAEPDGRILLGTNLKTNEKFYLHIEEPCELHPIADDIAICHPKIQNDSGKLVIKDVEAGWFIRVDHIKEYGVDPYLEKSCIMPKEPLLFLNLQAEPKSTCLIWEHTLDSNGKPCPNPRIVFPRRLMNNIVNEPVEIDIRSFGVRTPPCSKDNPSYGIIGLMHILPPALGWLWRLVAPRGYANPSIVDTEVGMTSEGIGSYGPFLTGSAVTQANLLLEQIVNTPNTRYILLPNQHIGNYAVGFMPQWIAREYIARRGSAKFKPNHLTPARLPILGFCLESMKVEGQYIRTGFLQPEAQSRVGVEGYDKGAKILTDFFKQELQKYNTPELHPLGKKIIECCLNDGTLEDYLEFIPIRY